MKSYKYLIIGGGMTADAAVQGIREVDPAGSIGMFSADSHPPYDRPPLTKGLWKGKPFDSIWRAASRDGVDLQLGLRIVQLDTKSKHVTDERGTSYGYEKLLLATGGEPRRLPFGDGQIIYYRNLDDYQQLRSLTEKGERFAVIGGGFIGSEIAAALAMNGKKVAMAFPEEAIGARMFPTDLARFLNDYYRQKGVEVLPGETATALESQSDGLALTFRNSQTGTERLVEAEAVVAGIGIQPNVELAKSAGLQIENGVQVSRTLQTSDSDIYAAGDVANFYNPALGRHLRVEHEDNANTMGKLAGQSMAGLAVDYDHLPFFYSDLFDLGYEAVGELDSRLETVADWTEQFKKGVVYYLRDGRVRGVLLWNVWEQVDEARKLIAEPGPFRPESLKGRLPR